MYANINNECRFDGTLTQNPELTYIPYGNGNQMAKCTFSITVLKSLTKEQKEKAKNKGDYITDIVPCVITGKRAETVANNFVKGKPIKVTAVFTTFSYTDKQGVKKYGYNFDVTDFGFPTLDFSGDNADAKNTINNNFNYNEYNTPVDDGDMPF